MSFKISKFSKIFKSVLKKAKKRKHSSKSSKAQESGRSMVEILGMLAIAGILTTLSIVGFRYALQVSREDNTLDIINKTASGAITGILESQFNTDLKGAPIPANLVISNVSVKPDGHTIETSMGMDIRVYRPSADDVEFRLDNVTYSICEKLLSRGENYTSARLAQEGAGWVGIYNSDSKEDKASFCEEVDAFMHRPLKSNPEVNPEANMVLCYSKTDMGCSLPNREDSPCGGGVAHGARLPNSCAICQNGRFVKDPNYHPTSICHKCDFTTGYIEELANASRSTVCGNTCCGSEGCNADGTGCAVVAATPKKAGRLMAATPEPVDDSNDGNETGNMPATNDCNGQGQWQEGTQTCLCNEGFEGSNCETPSGYSPCQTYAFQDGKEVREFKPEGTPCEQACIRGVCDKYGHCVPEKGIKCNSIDGCDRGYFCNYGGHAGDYQGGGTPDICEVVSTKSFEYEGKLYLYNTDTDLRSWCRSADKGKNCTWGFLSYYGAQSWCKSLNAELVEPTFIRDNCDVFSILPSVMKDQQYWTKGQSVVHIGNECSIQKMGRTDGYASAGGVLCVTDSEDDAELTDEDKDFIEEMRQAKQIFNRLDQLRSKKVKFDAEKRRYQELKSQNRTNEISQFQEKYSIMLYLEALYEEMMPIFEQVDEIATNTLKIADNLTIENIKKIHKYKMIYEKGNYPQKLIDIMGLGELLSVKSSKETTFNIRKNILKELFGVKTANAGLGGGAVGYCSGTAVYDFGIGVAGSGLDSALGIFDVETDNACATFASYLQVGANVDRFVDGCGLGTVNHVDDMILNTVFDALFNLCKLKILCADTEVYVLGYGCCLKSLENMCKCHAKGGTYVFDTDTCCDGHPSFWEDSTEQCVCEAKGNAWCKGNCCDTNEECCEDHCCAYGDCCEKGCAHVCSWKGCKDGRCIEITELLCGDCPTDDCSACSSSSSSSSSSSGGDVCPAGTEWCEECE